MADPREVIVAEWRAAVVATRRRRRKKFIGSALLAVGALTSSFTAGRTTASVGCARAALHIIQPAPNRKIAVPDFPG